MATLDKKDIEILLDAGFDEADLGLVPGGRRGIELYQTPEDYFAKELIENACEQGECDLYDEIIPGEPTEPYDNDRPGLYDDEPYAGNEDPAIDVPPDVRDQVELLDSIKIGKMTCWGNRRNNFFDTQIKSVVVDVPQKEKTRMWKMSPENRKKLWLSYVKEGWKELWKNAVSTLYSHVCETIVIGEKKKYNLIVIDTKDMKKLGHKIPKGCEWITMMYFEKQTLKPMVRPRRHI